MDIDLYYGEFEDTKGVIRIRKSKENRQHNRQKKKDKTTNHLPLCSLENSNKRNLYTTHMNDTESIVLQKQQSHHEPVKKETSNNLLTT